MKTVKYTPGGWLSSVVAVCLGCWLLFPGPVLGQRRGVALLIQQSPDKGGVVTPGQGVHYFAPNSKVSLIAIPAPGYRFLRWLGDVVDPNAPRTVACLDKPKIVIAVFERTSDELLSSAEAGPITRGVGGPAATMPSVLDFSGSPPRPSVPYPPLRIRTSPGFSPPVPPPVEPSTVLLLGLGVLVLRHGGGRS